MQKNKKYKETDKLTKSTKDTKASKAPKQASQALKGGDAHDRSNMSRMSPVLVASIWVGLGASALTTFLPVAMAMMAYGFNFLFSQEAAAKKVAIPLLCGIAGFAVGSLFPPATWLAVAEGVLAFALSYLVAYLVATKRATITTAFALSALTALLLIAAEAGAAWLHHQTLMGTLQLTVTEAMNSVKSLLPLEMQAQVSSMVPLAELLWPFALFCMTGTCVALSHAAARIANLNVKASRKKPVTLWKLSSFEAPLWAPVVLAAGIAFFFFGPALAFVDARAAFWAQAAGLSTILAVRFVFLLDGAGVIAWFLEKKTQGCLVRTLVWIIALYFESFCFIVSIVGLIDYWANMRKFKRGNQTKRMQGSRTNKTQRLNKQAQLPKKAKK